MKEENKNCNYCKRFGFFAEPRLYSCKIKRAVSSSLCGFCDHPSSKVYKVMIVNDHPTCELFEELSAKQVRLRDEGTEPYMGFCDYFLPVKDVYQIYSTQYNKE